MQENPMKSVPVVFCLNLVSRQDWQTLRLRMRRSGFDNDELIGGGRERAGWLIGLEYAT